MIWIFFLVAGAAGSLVILGATSVWVKVLSTALSVLGVVVVLVIVVALLGRLLRR